MTTSGAFLQRISLPSVAFLHSFFPHSFSFSECVFFFSDISDKRTRFFPSRGFFSFFQYITSGDTSHTQNCSCAFREW